jgi:CO/xanthine dehydrogenase FAD-binding subunit
VRENDTIRRDSVGRTLSRDTIRAASRAAVRDAHPLEKNTYKLPLFRGVIEEELHKLSRRS